MKCYVALDHKVALQEGKNQERGNFGMEKELLSCLSIKELKNEFLEFLTNEKKDKKGFPWDLASREVCIDAYKTFEAEILANTVAT